jgi:hypothetical protein
VEEGSKKEEKEFNVEASLYDELAIESKSKT